LLYNSIVMKVYIALRTSLMGMLFTARLALAQNKIIVFQSDFGLKDGALPAMKGVALEVSNDLKCYDLTHQITAYNI